MAAAAVVDIWNQKIVLANRVQRTEIMSIPNFVKIGQSVVKILRFFNFSRWRTPPSWIVKFAKFYWLTVWPPIWSALEKHLLTYLLTWPRHITVPNFIKIVRFVAEILQFFKFLKMADVRHLGLVLGIFRPHTVSTCGSLSLCKIGLWSMQ